MILQYIYLHILSYDSFLGLFSRELPCYRREERKMLDAECSSRYFYSVAPFSHVDPYEKMHIPLHRRPA